MMNKLLKKRDGFSMTEAVIGLVFVLIVSITAITIVMSAITTKINIFNKTRAQYFAENALECFKVSSEDDFGDHLNFILPEGEEIVKQSNKTYVYTSN